MSSLINIRDKQTGKWISIPTVGEGKESVLLAVQRAEAAAQAAENTAEGVQEIIDNSMTIVTDNAALAKLSAERAAKFADDTERIETNLEDVIIPQVYDTLTKAGTSAENASAFAVNARNYRDSAKEYLDDVKANADKAEAAQTTAEEKANQASGAAVRAQSAKESSDATATALIEFLNTKQTLSAPAVDATLAIEGAAADAKAVGDILAGIKDGCIEAIVENTWKPVTGISTENLQVGTMKGADGTLMSATNRIRTTKLTKSAYRAIELPLDDFKIRIYGYESQDYGFIEMSGWMDAGEGNIIVIPEEYSYVRYLFSYKDDRDVDEATDIPLIAENLIRYTPTDKSLKNEYQAADAKAVGDRFEAVNNSMLIGCALSAFEPIRLDDMGTPVESDVWVSATLNNLEKIVKITPASRDVLFRLSRFVVASNSYTAQYICNEEQSYALYDGMRYILQVRGKADSGIKITPQNVYNYIKIEYINPVFDENAPVDVLNDKLTWLRHSALSTNNGKIYCTNTNYENSGGDEPKAYHTVSYPVKLPKGGISLGSNISGYANVFLLKKDGDDFTLVSTARTNFGRLFKQSEENDLYFSIEFEDNGTEYKWIYGGTARTGRLTNLMPCRCYYNSDTSRGYIAFGVNSGSKAQATYTQWYGSVLRLCDVDKVYCDPKYQMCAVIFKRTAEGFEYADTIRGTYSSVTELYGQCVIDLTKYDFEGYARLAVRCKVEAGNEWKSMGIFASYEDVENSVYVQYKNGVYIEHEKCNNVFKDNLRLLSKGVVPYLKGGTYTSPLTGNGKINYSSLYDASVMQFYAGGVRANAPLQHISMESFLTAAQNPNSRARYANRTADATTYSYQYGYRCNNMGAILCGYPESYLVGSLRYDLYDKVKRINIKDWAEDTKIGDWVCHDKTASIGSPNNGSHLMVITDKVYVNGELYSVELTEAYPPICRRRCLFFPLNLPCETIESEYSSSEKKANMVYAARPSVFYSVRDTFGFNPDVDTYDYKVGKIMCERGTNANYVTLNAIYLTLADDVQRFDIFKDGAIFKELTNEDVNSRVVETRNDLRVVKLLPEDLDGNGYYTLRVNGNIEESFYIVADETITITEDGDNLIVETSAPDKVYYAYVHYKGNKTTDEDNDGTEEEVSTGLTYTVAPEDVKDGVITIPKEFVIKNENNNFAVGTIGEEVVEPFDFIRVLMKNEFGTYWCSTKSGETMGVNP